MACSRLAVLALAALATTTNALVVAEARRDNEIAPRTADPRHLMPLEAHLVELGKRQATATSESAATWTVAPGSTCGYLSGSPGNAITCAENRTCMWNVPVGFLCYDAQTAVGYVTCLASSRAVDPDVCDDVCQSNSFYLRCTASSAPFCRTYAYPSGVRDYQCVSSSQTRISSVDWTYTGQDNPGFSLTVAAQTTTSLAVGTTATTNNNLTIDPASTSSEPAATSTEPSKKSSKPPVGAIVGGVVGGVAVVGFIVLGAIYILRRKRKSQAAPPQQPQMAAAPPQFDQQHSPPNVDQKPYVASPVQSTIHSPVQSTVPSDWRGSSVMSPQSTTALSGFSAELSAVPPGYSNEVHEMPGSHDHHTR